MRNDSIAVFSVENHHLKSLLGTWALVRKTFIEQFEQQFLSRLPCAGFTLKGQVPLLSPSLSLRMWQPHAFLSLLQYSLQHQHFQQWSNNWRCLTLSHYTLQGTVFTRLTNLSDKLYPDSLMLEPLAGLFYIEVYLVRRGKRFFFIRHFHT